MTDRRRTLYPAIEPYRTGTLTVDAPHVLYFEECGNPKGEPVLFVHGGPGGGLDARSRCFFDPTHYRIVLFDQRGCGKSTPHAELSNNSTWDLVADMERLRRTLRIERWLVFGGSWGSTLALAYAQTHPTAVTGLVLRGIFLLRQREIDWFYQDGANHLFPDAWEHFLAPIPESERGDMVRAYYARLTAKDAATRLEAARAWSIWEGSTSTLFHDPDLVAKTGSSDFAIALARIECHFFLNKGFFAHDDQLLRDAHRLRDIPGVIVQGRYDVVCPAESAWALHRVWPAADLRIVPDAGHSAMEPGTIHELISATDRLRDG